MKKRILMGTAALVAFGVAPALAQQPLKIGFISTFTGASWAGARSRSSTRTTS